MNEAKNMNHWRHWVLTVAIAALCVGGCVGGDLLGTRPYPGAPEKWPFGSDSSAWYSDVTTVADLSPETDSSPPVEPDASAEVLSDWVEEFSDLCLDAECDDGKICTDDSCDPAAGCIFEVNCPGSEVCDSVGLCCTPLACGNLGLECGGHDNGCDGIMNCGGCPPDQLCKEGVCSSGVCEMEWVDSFGGEAWDVFVSDGTAYVALGFGGLYIFDVSDPAEPAFLGRLDTPGEANGVWVAGG